MNYSKKNYDECQNWMSERHKHQYNYIYSEQGNTIGWLVVIKIKKKFEHSSSHF